MALSPAFFLPLHARRPSIDNKLVAARKGLVGADNDYAVLRAIGLPSSQNGVLVVENYVVVVRSCEAIVQSCEPVAENCELTIALGDLAIETAAMTRVAGGTRRVDLGKQGVAVAIDQQTT